MHHRKNANHWRAKPWKNWSHLSMEIAWFVLMNDFRKHLLNWNISIQSFFQRTVAFPSWMSEIVMKEWLMVGEATLQEIRNSGIWIINWNWLVQHVIYNCVKCRSMRGRIDQQIIVDLPKDRVNEAPPFTYCGVDLFGPFLVKERWSEMKRYGALFTYLASRAVHIEVVASMETDSLIMALLRVIARRGNIRTIKW